VVHSVIRAYCVISWTAYWVFRFARNTYKTKNLGVLNSIMFIGKPGGCNTRRVSNRSRGVWHYCSNRSRGLLLKEIW